MFHVREIYQILSLFLRRETRREFLGKRDQHLYCGRRLFHIEEDLLRLLKEEFVAHILDLFFHRVPDILHELLFFDASLKFPRRRKLGKCFRVRVYLLPEPRIAPGFSDRVQPADVLL